MSQMSKQEIEARVRALSPWFHNMDLGGIATAPDHFLGDFPRSKFERFQSALPDVRGRSVLDVGCNAGFYSLELKRRGARRVVGIDSDERYLAQARLASEVTGLEIELHNLSVYEVGKLGEQFDVVLFMGVLYHLRHPLLALDLLHEHVVGHTMVFQSLQRGSDEVNELAEDYPFAERAIFDEPSYPKLHFVEHSYAGDPTNWWIPNRACVEAMLRSTGFDVEASPEKDLYVCRKVQRARDSGEWTAFRWMPEAELAGSGTGGRRA